jgi:hypothetical protein
MQSSAVLIPGKLLKYPGLQDVVVPEPLGQYPPIKQSPPVAACRGSLSSGWGVHAPPLQ